VKGKRLIDMIAMLSVNRQWQKSICSFLFANAGLDFKAFTIIAGKRGPWGWLLTNKENVHKSYN